MLSVGQLVHWSIWIYFSKLLSVSQRLWSSMGGLFRASEGSALAGAEALRAPWPLRWWPSSAPSSFFKRWVTDISPSPCSLWSTNSYPPSAWRFKCNHCDYLFSIVTTLNNHITYRHLDFNILILTEVEDWLLHSDSSFVFCRRPLTFPFEKFDFPTT